MSVETDQAPPRRGRRPLDRDLILGEAVRFIDEHGREHLTMRRLGAVLDVEAMALYRYVPGREDLLDGVVEVVMDEIYDLTITQAREVETWQEYLQQVAHGVRTVAIAHPRVFPLVATRPPAAPWLRPPLRSLKWVESFLRGLVDHGFSHDETVRVYRTFATFLLGHLLLESSTTGEDLGLPESDTDAQGGPGGADPEVLAAYPLLQSLSDQLAENAYEREFEDALEDLLNRLEVDEG